MAIYRGPGGAGDATNDATSQAILAAQSAQDAAASEVNAAASAASASTSASNAATSATNAASSASTATTQANNAASSASSAATSAATATTKASEASTSATNAASSASAASTSATAAASSASAASTSASAASTSATNAATSATTASTQASNAASSASAAATSATNAASSASAASTSATNAAASATSAGNSATSASASATSATASAATATTKAAESLTNATNASNSASAAATSATNAATSATNAANSATSASTSATNAGNSASAAAASAAAAAASYDNFDDRYLGTKSTAPTLDNDGNALVTGALYYNDGTSVIDDKGMWVYDGAQWLPASAAAQAILVTYKYVATAGQTTFSGADSNALTLSYTPGSILVTLNGVILDKTDYTATTGTSVVLGTGAVVNDEVAIYAFSTFDVANTYTQAQADSRFFNVTGDSISGNLTFTGTGNRITGLMDGSSQTNRVAFQTSSANQGTTLGVIPNGTSNVSQVNLYSSSTPDNASLGQIRITSSEMALNSSLFGTGTYLPMTFYTSGSERVRIDTSGNVGIGTSSPNKKLVISDAGANGIELQTNDGSTGTLNRLFSYNRSTSVYTPLVIQGSDLRFYTATSAANESMRIDSSGNLLVGTTTNTPNSRFVAIATSGSINGVGVYCTTTAATNAAVFYNSNGGVGSISVSGSATSYVTSSDYRLKENIQPMQNALGVVAQLNPVTYTWKADGSDGQGFIAHELQAVVPDCVTGEKDAADEDGNPVYQGIDTSFLVATLTKAIQELEARVKELENK